MEEYRKARDAAVLAELKEKKAPPKAKSKPVEPKEPVGAEEKEEK